MRALLVAALALAARAEEGRPFAKSLESKHFVIRSSIAGADLAALLKVAEDTRAATFRRLGVEAKPWKKRLPLFLCRHAADIKAAAARMGFPLQPGPRATGGFYRQGPVIAVVPRLDRIALTVSHEVVHAVMRPLFTKVPPTLHEGFAMSISERLVGGSAGLADYMKIHNASRVRTLRTARDNGAIPSLRNLLRFGYQRFHDKNSRLHYQLSWCLAEVLPDKGMRDFLKACAAQDAWRALKRVHDEAGVMARWAERIEQVIDAGK